MILPPVPPDPKPRARARRFVPLLCLGLLAAAGCQPAGKAPPQPRRVQFVTSRSAPSPAAVVVAPDGGAAACVTRGGSFVLLGTSGQTRLTRQFDGAFTAAIANAGRAAIVGGRSGGGYWVRILTERGRVRWRQGISGTLLAVAITPDGQSAFAATTDARLYVFSMADGLRWNRLKTERDIVSAVYSETADALIVETSNPDGFGMVDIAGHTRWWQGRPAGQFSLISGGRGSLIVTTLSAMTPTPSVEVTALTGAGRMLFIKEFEGYEPRAAISSDSALIAVSYRRKLVHEEKSVMERRVELWDRRGRALWREGGLFFKPVLAGLQEDPPGLLIAENYSLLSALDRNGRLAWRGPALRGDLVRLTHDESWRLGWAGYEDGSCELWRLSR